MKYEQRTSNDIIECCVSDSVAKGFVDRLYDPIIVFFRSKYYYTRYFKKNRLNTLHSIIFVCTKHGYCACLFVCVHIRILIQVNRIHYCRIAYKYGPIIHVYHSATPPCVPLYTHVQVSMYRIETFFFFFIYIYVRKTIVLEIFVFEKPIVYSRECSGCFLKGSRAIEQC